MASPNQSSTSLSDDDDDYNGITPVEHRTAARWSLSRQPTTQQRPRAPSEQPTPLSPAALLPTEILIHSLRQLTAPRDLYACLLVSKMWCECAVELLWHKPVVTKLPSLFKMITVIGKEEETTFAYSTFIRRLNFVALATEMSDLLFSRIAACTRLERLTLVGCAALTDDAIGKVLPCCPNLVALDLTNVIDVSDAALLQLAKSASRLQGINLGGCKKVTDVGITALARSCPLLRRIKLSGLTEITDDSVSVLASECPLLLEVDLNCCNKVSPKSVQDLWKMSKHMRELRLSQCLSLTDDAFPVAPSVPDSSLIAFQLPQSLPPLRLPNLFDHLRMLDLTSLSVTDAAVDGIISVAPKIRNLVLAKCSELTDKSVESICRLGKHLHYLHLGHATAITDTSVRLLAMSCTRLRYIDLACCTLLTDLSVFELSNLPKLRRIGLVRVNNLTDDGVASLVHRSNTLERIHLSYCENISLRAVHLLLNRLGRLTHLSLTGIPAFRKPELQKFCRSPPREFNTAQRQAFCVYSGTGIAHLRNYLNNMMAKLNKTDPNIYAAPYFQRLGVSLGARGMNGLNDPIVFNGLELDSGDDGEGTVVDEGNTPRGPRGRAGPSTVAVNGNGNTNGNTDLMAPTLRPNSLPRETGSAPGSGSGTRSIAVPHHTHHTHSTDGRSSGLTTPGETGAEVGRSASLEPQSGVTENGGPSSISGQGSRQPSWAGPSSGSENESGKGREEELARSAPASTVTSDRDSLPVAGPSRSASTSLNGGDEIAFVMRHIQNQHQQLPVPAFDEPVYNRHSRRQQQEQESEDDDMEMASAGANTAQPSRGLGMRRVLKNTLSDAGALLFGRGSGSGSGSGGGGGAGSSTRNSISRS